ncbi:sentrin-specific protease 1 [Anguilla rostrata]|uniref:sentrin-specific protease 1 n=1 Tax=Anguilla rostrata TaxID=7938 RepID=UPI0030CE296C
MFNKLYEWIGTGIASLRNGAPANDQGEGVQQDGQNRRKRQINCVEDGEAVNQEDAVVKKFRMGDWIDTVKIAAKGVKTQGSSVASWVKSSVGPSLSNILPASPGPPPLAPPPEASPASRPATPSWAETEFQMGTPGSLRETFIMPSSTLTWKSCKSVHAEPLRMDRPALGTRAFGRPSYADVPRGEAPKTNGHSATLPPALAPRPCPSPRLGRTLNLTPRRSPSSPASTGGSAGSPFTSMYEKTFPIRVVQSPSHSSSARLRRRRAHCTAQESVQMEEKEVYRQLLTMVSEGQSALFRDGTSCTGLRSHRDLTSFLSSSRRLLQSAHPAGSSEGASAPSSPRPESSLGSSALPSPRDGSGGAETPVSSPGPGTAPAEPPEPAASPAQQGDCSHNALSSDPNGDSLIFVKEQPGKKQDASSVPCFHAELWIKELTSLYDSRARERRRLIEEQEALTTRLFRQRLSEEGHVGRGGVELQVRVPLEKEVPLAPVVAEIKAAPEEPEFPELTEVERAALRRGGPFSCTCVLLWMACAGGIRLSGGGCACQDECASCRGSDSLTKVTSVINFYMNMLVERSQRPGLPSVYTFNTFFYPKLRGAGFPAVRRWTKKVDVFASDILLVPVHLGVHWCLSVVDFRKKRVTYFDSMGGSNDEACRVLLKYLEQESQDKKGKQLDTSDWVLQSMKRSEIPQQMNGSDCGMFTCKYAEYITKDRPITFTQKHMPYFRRRMVWEILNRKLL